MNEEIQKRLDQLIEARKGYINNLEQLNKMIFGCDVAIGELQHLLDQNKLVEKPSVIGEISQPLT